MFYFAIEVKLLFVWCKAKALRRGVGGGFETTSELSFMVGTPESIVKMQASKRRSGLLNSQQYATIFIRYNQDMQGIPLL